MADWRAIIAEIRRRGRMRYADIATKVGVSENAIARLACGLTLDPHYSLGAQLIELQRRVTRHG